jgi:lipopolysaccharide/colanic/teichoic acid biosynthesis glycosyltransferase
MSRNHIRTTNEQGSRAAQSTWTAIFYWGMAISMGVFTWLYEQAVFAGLAAKPVGVFTALSLVALHAGLVIILERGYAYTPLRRDWQYRMALLSSIGLFWVNWIVLLISGIQHAGLVLPVLAFGGAFLGGLGATGLKERLWENNSPPSEWIQIEVYQRHQQVIGKLDPGPWTKRAFDLCLAVLGLAGSAPVWLATTFLVWFEDPGPVLFVKNSVGKGGRNFHQYKFRTMVREAENHTGPVLSQEGDERVLLVGRILRKTALDELPQLINILKGEMSFVGPRPQRTVLVHGYLETMPEYAERHRVLPGLSGLAQVAGDYYLTPRQKLRFDRLYIRHLGLGFDLKLLLLACMITFWFRWRNGWNGRLPRRLLR